MSKNKTQTISVSTLVKKLLLVQNFLLFNDLPSYNTIGGFFRNCLFTTYIRRDSFSLLYVKVGCCLLYPRCTGFTSDVFLFVALFKKIIYHY